MTYNHNKPLALSTPGMTEHSLVLDIVIRFLRLLGCPHACGEKMVSFATFFIDFDQFLPHHCHHEQGVGEC